MIDAANRIRPRRDGRHPFDKFFLLWVAFKQIYSSIALNAGLSTQLVIGEDGTIETYPNGHVNIPKVIPVRENEQIHLAVSEMDNGLKNKLILHESTRFFFERIPYWQGKPIKQDALGQRVNGVIIIGDTTSFEYPVWSPIDVQIFEAYLADPENQDQREFLARQIIDLLYTVSKNLIHFSNSFDDSNDISVAQNALPLIELIVAAFTQ